jgi:glucokinase
MADFILAGDIGGTKTRLGIFAKGKTSRPLLRCKATYSSRKSERLEEIIADFLGRHQVSIGAVCLGVAGAVVKGRVKATNLPWKVSEDSLSRIFSWPRIRLVNDLVATAYAVPLLRKNDLFPLQRGSSGGSGLNIGLMAPGTGLGTALLIACGGNYVPVPSEGGHVGFAPLEDDDVELWQTLARQYAHVSLERLISGPGLYNIYCWLRDSGRYDEPAWLAEQLNPDNAPRLIAEQGLKEVVPLCSAALEKFIAIMGAAAGDLALIGMTHGGLFLGGGIPPKILAKLREPRFIEAFNSKGRLSDIMPRFPVSVILDDQAALLGAAHCAFNHI